MKKLSVIIICKNEELVIKETLESISGWADEIIVLDSGSTDATLSIEKQFTDYGKSTTERLTGVVGTRSPYCMLWKGKAIISHSSVVT